MYLVTTALKKLKKLHKKIRGVQGGTSASKTISILQLLIDQCQTDETPQLTSVMSESMPHLKRGAMRDFKNIMQEHRYWNAKRWNATDYIYTFETGTQMEFFSLDMPHKVRGPRRKRGFVNEANNIPFETFDQLEIRTEDVLWLDWNPVAEFWWHEGENGNIAVKNREDAESIVLTYKDNEGLPESIVRSIESHKDNANWWKVYGEGLLGDAEGRIFTDWDIIDDIPHEAKLVRYGLDFGYSNDPTAIPGVYVWNNSLIFDQVAYQTGLMNPDIAAILKNQERQIIVADSAEPKSIDELIAFGLPVIAASKGAGSVLQGIQAVQDKRVAVTKRSIDILKEYRNYLWMTDKNGKTINEPSPFKNHMMDAIRYAVQSITTMEPRERKQPSRPRLLYGNRLSR